MGLEPKKILRDGYGFLGISNQSYSPTYRVLAKFIIGSGDIMKLSAVGRGSNTQQMYENSQKGDGDVAGEVGYRASCIFICR